MPTMNSKSLRPGYYATLDPDDQTTMTYWRVKKDGRTALWPPTAWYGPPRLLKKDAPKDFDERIAWMKEFNTRWGEWADRVHGILLDDPAGARRRFADLKTRCCLCGRPLRDDRSKTLGVGPDCREGIPEDVLTQLCTPAVATAHAARVNETAQ